MNVECDKIDLQKFYNLCKTIIYNNPDLYLKSIESIEVVTSWLNTLDSLDISLIVYDTDQLIKRLKSNQSKAEYISIITEMTVILNNIFYSINKPYKRFWKDNTTKLWNEILFPMVCLTTYKDSIQNELQQYEICQMDVNDYYHRYFIKLQEECFRIGINVDIQEYML